MILSGICPRVIAISTYIIWLDYTMLVFLHFWLVGCSPRDRGNNFAAQEYVRFWRSRARARSHFPCSAQAANSRTLIRGPESDNRTFGEGLSGILLKYRWMFWNFKFLFWWNCMNKFDEFWQKSSRIKGWRVKCYSFFLPRQNCRFWENMKVEHN